MIVRGAAQTHVWPQAHQPCRGIFRAAQRSHCDERRQQHAMPKNVGHTMGARCSHARAQLIREGMGHDAAFSIREPAARLLGGARVGRPPARAPTPMVPDVFDNLQAQRSQRTFPAAADAGQVGWRLLEIQQRSLAFQRPARWACSLPVEDVGLAWPAPLVRSVQIRSLPARPEYSPED